jgi:hypothetical protein
LLPGLDVKDIDLLFQVLKPALQVCLWCIALLVRNFWNFFCLNRKV